MKNSPAERSVVSQRSAGVADSGLAEVFMLARTRDAVDLSIGTPGHPEVSADLVEEAARAMRDGRNQYEHPNGEALLRRRIAESLTAPTDPDTEITVTAGATEALYIALLGSVDPGDEVVLFTPGFDQFASAIKLVGAVPRFVPLRAPDWRFDPAELTAAFGPRTRAVLLNTPSNPTGRVLTREELDTIARLCERWNVTVISDEVYSNFVFDGRRHLSVADVPGLAERGVVVGSLSKSHAVSGWRLGFLRADPVRTDAFRRVHALTTLGTAAPLQAAAGRIPWTDAEAASAEMQQRRDLAQDVFSRAGMKFAPAEGGCYLFADISPLTGGRTDSLTFIRELLDRRGVLLTPGFPFCSDPELGAQYVRIAFNRRMETLREAERRLLAA
ncbi:pyridoxal phosphate-dependent aminotransferase [Streptomyces naphthomycinicus]|uniref:pyridoxal phosphate-dependent aminotransferase n=1 Tax=Streptomyces naphthomycinicus TaxID=2872625 RepID=UPI001CED7975|nr:pyridoxal phosphate-dependent aminotransferase [Streptomyces sp. TML10]